jgi:uncharacterized protein YkwD
MIMAVIFNFRSTLVVAQTTGNGADVVVQSEEKIALNFHTLINDYRGKKLMLSLVWNDTIAKAASNHTEWMSVYNNLDHVERTKGPRYTGREVTDRINYAANMRGQLYCGENILFFDYEMDTTAVIADSMAANLASKAFEMWRNSPGHNANMLSRFKFHGVSFHYANGVIWSTNVFCGEDTSKYYFSLRRRVQLIWRQKILKEEFPNDYE